MWKSSIKKLETYQDDKLIWFCCEDDHVFIDNSLDFINDIVLKMKKLS